MAKRTKTAKAAASKARAKATAKAKQLRKQIEDTFEKTLERTVEKAMAIPQVERATKEAKRAKKTLDQALLDLQHKAIDLKSQPQDLIQKVGQRVLERAERIRSQVAETPYSPSWLKDLSLTPRSSDESGEAQESSEDSPEETASGAVVETKRAKVKLATPPSKKKSGGVKAKSAKKSSTGATDAIH